MKKYDCVAGIYVERAGARLILMSAERASSKEWWTLSYLAHEDVSWHPNDTKQAVEGLEYLLQIVKLHPLEPKGLGIASNGPFVSLKPSLSDDYGKLHPVYADLPLRGESLSAIIRRILGPDEWGLRGNYENDKEHLKPYVIHTDANACALGEAYTRNLHTPDVDKTRTLAFLVSGQGIGLGITRGPGIVTSALHPEVGLMPPRILVGDTLRPEKADMDYALSIAELANDAALVRRLGKIKRKKVSLLDVLEERDEGFWNFRAYYLAQACLACTVIVPPNMIAVGAIIDPLNDVGQRTRKYLREFFKKRKDDKQPLIDYEDARMPEFVSNSERNPHLPLSHSISTTGALGMCYEAVNAIGWGTVQNMRTHLK